MLSRHYRWLWISGLLVLLDQWTKSFAEAHLSFFHSHYVFPFFNWALVYNQGSAFSFLSLASGWQRWFLSIFAAVLSVAILISFQRIASDKRGLVIGLSLILGGAIGNLIDRLRFGYVVDFIDLHLYSWHWPVFNVADIAITCGTMIVLFFVCCPSRK